MNICQRLLGDYNLSRLYNSYIIESDDIGQALYEVGEFLTKSIFEGENLSITDAALDGTNHDLNPNQLQNFPDFFLVQITSSTLYFWVLSALWGAKHV